MGSSLPPWLLQSQFGRTNAFVSEEQKKEVHQYLQIAQDALHDLRSRINQLQRQEEGLVAQVDRCKVAIAPHKRLPADVLRYTFTMCLDECTTFPLFKNNMLLVLSQVCSAWRKIAHETSSFWSDITILRDDSEDHFSSPHLQSALDLWVKCAAGHPLSLRVYDDSRGATLVSPNKRKRFERFVITLLSCLNYRELKIQIDLLTLLKFKSHIPSHRLRQLEALSLFGNYSPYLDLDDLFPPGSVFERLTSLELNDDWNLRSSHIRSIIPWKNLRRFVLLHPLAPVICLEVLQQTRVLEYCHIVPANDDTLPVSKSMAEVKRVQVYLQHLRTLRVSSDETRDAEIFIDQLVLPALECVICGEYNLNVICGGYDLENIQGIQGSILNAVMRLCRRSGGQKVKEVHIDDSSSLQFQVLLRSMPHLRVIRFTNSTVTFDDDTLEQLSTGELGPCLNELEAKFKHDEAKITDMLRRRRECPRALNKEITPTFALKTIHR
ncbi:hypothetical protein APHAL10511_004018 [Amanita phalloides]|nr:hypothetical protein APHAL10511_004018 [Amanita phalloides]